MSVESPREARRGNGNGLRTLDTCLPARSFTIGPMTKIERTEMSTEDSTSVGTYYLRHL